MVVQRWGVRWPIHVVLGAFMVERATGRIVDLPGPPHYAPSGARFLSLSVCGDNCSNRIDIWSVDDGVAKLEWRYRIKERTEKAFTYEFVEWEGNEQIKLRILPEIEAPGDLPGKVGDKSRSILASLTRTEQIWTLDPQLPQ
ncbi:hypothetical protein [Bosea sp. BK604]|uniref:hypothetical protein n=1 Tax=Bosea sp. BK604 TaxID=2512180 RepID=UPI001044A64A|nr:hypothetical protein [Bosea sp. BK604]TCR60904.1 hypothetical protein EV560_115128 [Bosea sp. BK604]